MLDGISSYELDKLPVEDPNPSKLLETANNQALTKDVDMMKARLVLLLDENDLTVHQIAYLQDMNAHKSQVSYDLGYKLGLLPAGDHLPAKNG